MDRGGDRQDLPDHGRLESDAVVAQGGLAPSLSPTSPRGLRYVRRTTQLTPQKSRFGLHEAALLFFQPARGAPRVAPPGGSILQEAEIGSRERRTGPREEITLREAHADRLQTAQLLDCFHAFGNEGDAGAGGEAGNRAGQVLLDRVLIDVADERHVDLDEVGLDLRDRFET